MDAFQKLLKDLTNHQTAVKSELLKAINNIDKKVDKLESKLDDTRKELTERLDIIGLDLAKLSDDAPTNKDFNDLTDRVSRLEQQRHFVTA